MQIFTLMEVARKLKVPPRALSDRFYNQTFDSSVCPIAGSRRLIPATYLPVIESTLREAGIMEKQK